MICHLNDAGNMCKFYFKYIWNSLHPYETPCGSSVKWPHIPEIYKNGNVGRNSIYMTKSELMASVSFEYFSNIAKRKIRTKIHPNSI